MMSVSEKMVYDIVAALSAHYGAREEAILKNSVCWRVRMEYAYLNSRMLDASAEIVGSKYAKAFIMDIGRGIGYANSKIDAFSESSYKKSKIEIKRRIAEKLNLIDPAVSDFERNKK